MTISSLVTISYKGRTRITTSQMMANSASGLRIWQLMTYKIMPTIIVCRILSCTEKWIERKKTDVPMNLTIFQMRFHAGTKIFGVALNRSGWLESLHRHISGSFIPPSAPLCQPALWETANPASRYVNRLCMTPKPLCCSRAADAQRPITTSAQQSWTNQEPDLDFLGQQATHLLRITPLLGPSKLLPGWATRCQ